jgi:MFS family permease
MISAMANTESAKTRGVFYGWILVGIAFLTLTVAFGIWHSFSVFFVAILKEFGWSRAVTAGIFSVFLLVYSFMTIVVGTLLDRYGSRAVLSLGSLVIVLGLVATSRIQTVWQFYLFYGGLTAIGVCTIGHISHSIFLSNWFVKKRGLALGIALAGTGVGMTIFVPLTQYIIAQWGWRPAYLALAAIVLAVVFPLNLAFQRREPAAIGALPDGATEGGQTPIGSEGLDGQSRKGPVTLSRSLMESRFWLLFLVYFFTTYATQGTLVHTVAHAVNRGLPTARAAFFFGLLGIIGSAAKVFFGHLSDRVGRYRTFAIAMACAVAGVLCLLALQRERAGFMYGFTLFFGLGYGAAPLLLAAQAADLFHGRDFGKIFGTLSIALGCGGAAGSWINGWIFDVRGGYNIALSLAVVSFILVVFLYRLLHRRENRL